MRLLAIETSGALFSLALWSEKKETETSKKIGRGHAEIFFQELERLLKKMRWKLEDLDGIAVSIGPGSFTGVRVGLSTARALGQSLGKPLVGISTLDLLAQNMAKRASTVCAVVEALRREVYACVYSSDGKRAKRITEPGVFTPEALTALIRKQKRTGPVAFAGDGLLLQEKKFREFWGDKALFARGKSLWPSARVLAVLAAEEFREARGVSYEKVTPLYLRLALAEERQKERWGQGVC